MQRNLRFERFYPHPPERLWKALTDSRYLSQWVMENDFQPIVGHQFTFRTDPAPTFDGVLQGEVIYVDAPHELAYTFIGGMMRHKTVVRWTLLPNEAGTTLRLNHDGFTGFPDIIISAIIGFGWSRMFKDLSAVLDAIANDHTE